MSKNGRDVLELDPAGFNELAMCRSGPMVYNKNDIYVGGSLQKYGEFSLAEQAIFQQILRDGMVVVEVGANIGAHTVNLSRLVGLHGEVHAFEPQRIVFQTLCANLALNQCANVFARQMALGAVAGSISVPPIEPSVRANFGGISLSKLADGERVPIGTLDDFDLPACHFIKVDAEGMETEVLTGAARTIDMYRPLIYSENDRPDHSEELLTMIDRFGYDAYWHLAVLFNPDNFAGQSENIFPNLVSVNVLCIPKKTKMIIKGLPRVNSPRDKWRDVAG